MSRHLNTIVRSVLLEADAKGLTPEDPSFWREVGKTVDRYGRVIGDEVGRWSDAASELGSSAASGAAVLGKAALDTFVGQAHAPGSEEDVLLAREREVTLPKLVIPAVSALISHLALTKFRISAKISDAVGLPVRGIIAGKYGDEVVEDIFAGSVLHDVLLSASFVPGATVAAMLLDSVVYTAEGNRKGAIATLAMAGVFHAGGKVAARRADDAARGVLARKGGVEILAPKKYTDLSSAAKRGGFTHAVPPEDRVSAVVRFVEDTGRRMEAAGLKGGAQIAAAASQAVRSGEISIAPALDDARVAEAQKCASELMTPGPGGETPLAAAKRIRNEVAVRSPVELPPADRAGTDWLASNLLKKRDAATDALLVNMTDAGEAYRLNPTPENKATYQAAKEKYYKEGFRNALPDDLEADANREGTTHAARQTLAKGVMSTPRFQTSAKSLYSKLGFDVNIIPIVGTHEAMFSKYLTKYPKYLAGTEGVPGQLGTRVVVVPHDEGKAILDSVEGVETRGGKVVGQARIDTTGVDGSKITIVPITNTAGVDSLPTPWMISHGIFDSAAGNLLVANGTLPRTKQIVSEIEKAYNTLEKSLKEINKTDRVVGDVKRRLTIDLMGSLNISGLESSALGSAVNSGWGSNSRELLIDLLKTSDKIADIVAALGPNESGFLPLATSPAVHLEAERKGIIAASDFKKLIDEFEDLASRAAPMVGKKIEKGAGARGQPAARLEKTKQGVRTVRDYALRGITDHIAEIMSAAITKEAGYVPDFSHLQTPGMRAFLGEEGIRAVEDTARNIADILGENGQNAKAAFGEDMKGNVLFVFPD